MYAINAPFNYAVMSDRDRPPPPTYCLAKYYHCFGSEINLYCPRSDLEEIREAGRAAAGFARSLGRPLRARYPQARAYS